MKKGSLIIIEGTDCSGKETQSNLLLEKLKKDGYEIDKFNYPQYDSPTGKIVGGCYLGKSHIGEGYFSEGAANVNPKVASLYYAADRLYDAPNVEKSYNEKKLVLLDRYVFSNFAHQGGKITDEKKRHDMYNWLYTLEFDMLKLRVPDIKILIYMPYEYALELKKNRQEEPDQHEMNEKHLRDAENAYLEIAKLYDFKIINCIKDNKIRSIEDINEEIYNYVKSLV